MILKETQRKVIINAGHHDHDPGKIITYETFQEADEVKIIRDHLVELLRKIDVEAYFVPDSLNLTDSIAWTNGVASSLNAGYAIDIHLNANNNHAASGAEAYHGSTKISKDIATVLSRNVAASLGVKDRGPKDQSQTYVGTLAWINQVKVRSSLVEVCFMTNKEDWLTLQSGGHRKAAIGIANAICELFGLDIPEWDPKPAPPAPPEPVRKSLLEMFISLIRVIFKFMNKENTIEEAVVIKEAHENELLSKKNVVGVGVGPKNKEGATSIIVLVETKQDLMALDEQDVVPSEIDGVPTDVIEVGNIEAMAEHTEKRRPVYGGTSAIWYKGTACTLGAIVYKGKKAYALQNTHCAFPHWKGAKIGDNIIQPSPNDGGSKTKDIIGFCAEGTELVLDNATNNYFDSALVELTVPEQALTQENLGDIDPIPAAVKIGDIVKKSGRTTGTQESKVIAVGLTVTVNYGKDSQGNNLFGRFANQIIAENKDGYFTSGGDSSSLVVNDKMQPVGQIFAGSQTIAIFSPIQPIIERYGFSFEKESEDGADGYMALGAVNGMKYAVIDIDSAQENNTAGLTVDVNLRRDASTSQAPKRVLKSGTKVKVVGPAEVKNGLAWAKVKILG